MNAYANHVVSYLLTQSWQIALLAGIVGLISLALRNRTAHIRYLLWLIVLAKCLVPPLLTVPLAVLPERSPSPSLVGIALPEEDSALETPVSVGGAAQPQEPKSAVPTVRALLALVWATGVLFFLLWVGGRAARYTGWLRDRRRPLPSALQESVRELSEGFKFRKSPRIWLLDDISQPFVWGVLRGSVYLPADFVDSSGSERQRSVLAHEISHIARFDAGVNLLQVIAQAAYWFHPFVWWSNRRIRQEREKCCDEMAVAHLRTPPEHYTGAIVDALAAERRSAHPIPSLAIVGSVKDIEERIRTMLKPGKKFHKRPSLVAATVVFLIALATLPTALVLTARGQVQSRKQGAEKPSANSEKPEQPRFAARTFNAQTAFEVWVQEHETSRSELKRAGRTPSVTPLEIPACWLWTVSPVLPVEDWDMLSREISQNKVPGLFLGRAAASDLRHLAGLTALRLLDLRYVRVTDASLEHLKGLTGLQELSLGGTQITDAGLENLKGLTELRRLWLTAPRITDVGIQPLKGLIRMRDLGLSTAQITDAGLAHLTGLTALQELNVGATRITDVGLADLKSVSTLQVVNLSDTKITDAGLAHLQGLTGLRSLNVFGTQITDAGLSHLKGLTGLEDLELPDQITDAGVEHLKGLTRLQTLWLSGKKITDAGVEHLKGFTRLGDLVLNNTQITDAGLEHLKGLPELQDLRLRNTAITDAGLRHLKGATGLSVLDLSNTNITDAGLEHLKGLTAMRWLYLEGTKITDAGLEHLKGMTRLQLLNVSRTQVTDTGLQRLKQSLPELRTGSGSQAK